MFHLLFCLLHNLIELGIYSPFELGLDTHTPCFVARTFESGLDIRSPCFVAGPFELGLATRRLRSTAINRSTPSSLHSFVLSCVPIMIQGFGLLELTLGRWWHIVTPGRSLPSSWNAKLRPSAPGERLLCAS